MVCGVSNLDSLDLLDLPGRDYQKPSWAGKSSLESLSLDLIVSGEAVKQSQAEKDLNTGDTMFSRLINHYSVKRCKTRSCFFSRMFNFIFPAVDVCQKMCCSPLAR